VLGVEKSMKLLEKLPGVEAYFISADSNGNYKIEYSEGFEKLLKKKSEHQ